MSGSSSHTYVSHPAERIEGVIKVAGDKSISHRSLMLGSLAEGKTTVSGFLEGEDSLATLNAFTQMGVQIRQTGAGQLEIDGVGLHGLRAAQDPIYLGNSGTSIRLLSGLLSGQSFDSELTGDESLSKRPMSRVAAPLSLMGAKVDTADQGRPPLRITGGKKLLGIEYPMPVASAQVKSCLLLAGLYAKGETAVIEPAPTRDHTERMLRAFGYEVNTHEGRVSLKGGGSLKATHIDVPGDISSATFFMVAASIAENAVLTIENVGINPTRDGVISILKLMGADLQLKNERLVGGEPIADIVVRSAPLKGVDIPKALVPLAIDEFPALFVAAACAEGVTRLTGAEELRVKESDRIQAMADGLSVLGIKNKVYPDGIEIKGGTLKGGRVDSLGDHRIAMSFALAGIRSKRPVEVLDCANVATSFPNFVALANQVGMNVETHQ